MSKGRPDNRYKNVLDLLAYKIFNGEICAGEMFYSRKTICDEFGISAMTAAKVQSELQERGLLTRVPGRGLYVNSIKKIDEIWHERLPLNKVRIIGAQNAIGPGTIFGSRLVDGIRQRCHEKKLEFNVEYINNSMIDTEILNNSHNIAADEGLVLFLHSGLLHEVMIPLLSYKIRSVIANMPFPWRPSVLSDNHDGIYQLLKYLHERGLRRVIYAACFSNSPVGLNENERMEAFLQEAPRFGMEYRTILSGNYYDLLHEVSEFRPDAVMFSADDPALKFKNMLASKPGKMPLITGFDDIAAEEPGLENLTTYRVDCEALGAASVDTLCEYAFIYRSPLNKRVKGTLITRE